ncbi:hypothetical protein EIP91_003242 [Steccherinum ochraceum]|uniref:Uncharacterized protein n=1 Tax=Steccherinum ochraceum TaxID=92696 RepID=A0A4R0RP79_9APHY|nr:hypothetical protein EIP91_003242 [Steccherinum ochraceum]
MDWTNCLLNRAGVYAPFSRLPGPLPADGSLASLKKSTFAVMNKNPFAPAYTPHQPPLPPGPPPPQPAQADYSAYWAAAAAAQHAQQPAGYNPQWPAAQAAPAAPRPPPEQSALYANYGYGGQQNLSWQQRQPQQHFQPPPPVAQAPPPPQAGYNPYQPQTGVYQQPYVPQIPPPQAVPPQPTFQPAMVQQPPQQFHQQPGQPFFPAQQQQRPQNQQQRNHAPHHSPSQHLPPAKRQRFDGPNRGQPPVQPQFQPSGPVQQAQSGTIGGGVTFGQSQGHSHGSRGGAPGVNQVPLGAARGGSFSGGRGNGMGNRGGRGGAMGMNRGGRGRGGMYNNSGGRGGMNQGGGSFRGHGSNRGFGNRDNRRGGSFTAGGQGFSHQQQSQPQQHPQGGSGNSSYRGRNQSFGHSNRRHESGAPHGPRDAGSTANGSGKKDENRRTLTDFKILALEIRDIGWSWGLLPLTKSEVKQEPVGSQLPSSSEDTSSEATAEADAPAVPPADEVPGVSTTSPDSVPPASAVSVKSEVVTAGVSMPPPPSRIRIYFHTPATADDTHPITPQSSFTVGSSESSVRKGKRKKLDDDGDLEDGRGPPPPPPGVDHDAASLSASVDYDGSETLAGRDSVAPSVTSEGDWLMAAINDDLADGEGEDEDTLNVDEHLRGGGATGDEDADGSHYGSHDGMHVEDDTVHSSAVEGDGSHFEPSGGDDEHQPPPDAWQESAMETSHPAANAEPAVEEGKPDEAHANGSVSSFTSSAQDTSAAPSSSQAAPSSALSDDVTDAIKVDDVSNRTAHLQVSSLSESHPSSGLKREDSTATLPDLDGNEGPSPYASTVLNEDEQHPINDDMGEDGGHDAESTPVDEGHADFENGHSTENQPMGPPLPPEGAETAKERTPSANRLSISYAAGTRRMVINAEAVDKLRVHRGEARIEVFITVNQEGERLKGIEVEEFLDASTSYKPIDIATHTSEDHTVPPFYQNATPYQTVLVAHLDKERPLSEPRWVKTGDVQDWLRSMFGRMFWVAGDAAEGWEKKIEVVDPDPPPTIFTVLEAWATNSSVGVQIERQRFLRTHMTETDNILEILLRLVRGERATYNQSSSAISAPSVSGPLLSALSPGSAHGAQQTHVSLAVLAIFRLSVEFAKKAVGDAGKGEVEERVGEIIRSLPSHLIYKSLDGIFKEWKVEKKGGGRM